MDWNFDTAVDPAEAPKVNVDPQPDSEEDNMMKMGVLCGVLLIAIVWFTLIIVAFSYFARCSAQDVERYRVSLGFSMATILFPPFAMVPVCLNIR